MLYSLTILFRRICPCSPLFGKDIYGGRTINSPVSLSNDLNLSEDITDPTVVILWKTLLKTPLVYSARILGISTPYICICYHPHIIFTPYRDSIDRGGLSLPQAYALRTASMISHFNNMLPTIFSVLILPFALRIHLQMYTLGWLS